MASETNKNPVSVYDFTVKDAMGKDVDLNIYKGKVLLIVNVASKCGMTNSNYTELNQLYEKYKDQEFPIFDKIEVNGDNTAPLYKFLKTGKWGIIGDEIQWNFAKFLVNKDGQAVDRYYPTTSPLTIERDVRNLLGH
uniref:Thioredoxin domain-containing protein n=1 Tax=Daucus carota subsp. sativus TaxID=79200 RepID=A0A166FM88_DAUCS